MVTQTKLLSTWNGRLKSDLEKEKKERWNAATEGDTGGAKLRAAHEEIQKLRETNSTLKGEYISISLILQAQVSQ